MATLTLANAGGNVNSSATFGGAGTPTNADDIVGTATSGTLVVNVAAAARSIDLSLGGSITVNSGIIMSVGGSTAGPSNIALKLAAGTTISLGNSASGFTFNGTTGTAQTILTAGKNIGAVAFSGAGGSWTLSDTLNMASGTHTNGTLNLNGQTVNGSTWSLSGSNTRTASYANATFNLTAASGTAWNATTTTNLTSTLTGITINLTGGAPTFSGGSLTYAAVSLTGNGQITVSNQGTTFGNFTYAPSSASVTAVLVQGGFTVTGVLTLTGFNDTTARCLVMASGGVLGVTKTITANGSLVLANVDFMDTVGAGSVSWNISAISGGSGDAGGNSGITFTPSAQQTRLSGNGTWGDVTKWTSRVPLPQDDVVIPSSAGNITASDCIRWGRNIDFTGYTGTFTRTSSSTAYTMYGNLTLGSGMNHGSAPNTFNLTFGGRGSQTITSNGSLLFPSTSNQTLTIAAPGGSYEVTDTLVARMTSATGNSFTITNGTLDLNGQSVTVGRIVFTGTAAKGITGNGASVYLESNGASTLWDVTAASTTVSMATSSIEISGVENSATRAFNGGTNTYGSITYTVASSIGIVAFTGAMTVGNLTIGAGRGVTFQASTTFTITGTFTYGGANFGYQQMASQDAANLISAPNSAALQLTGDITLEAKLQLPNWSTPSQFVAVSKLNSAATAGYGMRINGSGQVVMFAGATSGTNTTSLGTVFGPNDIGYVRVTRRQSDGRMQVFTSPDGSTWTQLGANVTIASGVATPTSTDLVYIGSRATANDIMVRGRIYYVKIYSDVTPSTVVFNADFSTKTWGADTFTESSVNAATVTIGTTLINGDGRLYLGSGTNGSAATLSVASAVPGNYMKVRDSTASGTASPLYAGSQSTNVSNNTNWLFSTLQSLAGSSAGTAGDAGLLSVGLVLSGRADGGSSVAGDIVRQLALDGSADGVSTASSPFVVGLALSGSSAGQSSAAALANLNLGLAGSNAGTATTSGSIDVTTSGDSEALDGRSDGVATVLGSLGVLRPVSGSAGGVSGSAGSASMSYGIAGTSSAVVTATGLIVLSYGLSGSTGAVSIASAVLGLNLDLAGQIAGSGSVVGDLSVAGGQTGIRNRLRTTAPSRSLSTRAPARSLTTTGARSRLTSEEAGT